MSTLTLDIATMLVENGFGTIGVDIFIGVDEPPKPDSVLIVRSTGTSMPDLPLHDLSYPTIQITARTSRGKGQECEGKIYAVKDFFKYIGDYTVNSSRFIFINHLSGPTAIGLDKIMRPLYTLNLTSLRTTTL